MGAERIPLNGQSYEAYSVDVNTQRTVNWYPEQDSTGKNNLVLYPTPGWRYYKELTTTGSTLVRGMLVTDYGLIVVKGNKVVHIDWTSWNNGTETTYALTLLTSNGDVSIASTGETVLIVDGTNGYLLDIVAKTVLSSNLDVTDADFPQGATSCCAIDGYYIVNDPNNTNAIGVNGAFFISGSYNGLTWAALDYDVADRKGDQIVAVRNVNGQLWLVGTRSTEVWYNSGRPSFPFERVNGAIMEYGTFTERDVCVVANTLVMLARTDFGGAQVMVSNGYSLVKVSNYAIDYLLQSQTDTDLGSSYSFVMQYFGHTWYALTVGSRTLVLDAEQNLWFEWCYSGDNTKGPIKHYAYYVGCHIASASSAAPTSDQYVIWKVEKQWYAYAHVGEVYVGQGGQLITRLRQTPHFHMQERAIFCTAVHLKFEQGVGGVESYQNPQVMLQWSDDGGHTWSSEHWRAILGAVGEYNSPAVWRRMGRFYDRVWRIKMTDPVKAVLIDAYMDADIGVEDMRK